MCNRGADIAEYPISKPAIYTYDGIAFGMSASMSIDV